MSYSKIFFTNVLRLASEKNLSHQDLAERANLSPSSMSGITRGQGNPTLETMSAIAYALDVPLSYLLEHHDLDPESLSLLDGSQSTLPPNYEKIIVILPRYKAFQVKKWNDDALKALAKETK
ncbi:TPA: transcriptional regulator [Neisseria gonorrhoeae]